jgi:hypothetical protein
MIDQIEYDRMNVSLGDIARCRFVFTGEIPSADTISSVALTASPTGLTEVTAARVTTAQVVDTYVSTTSGAVGTEYLVTCTVTTSSGAQKSLYQVLRVIEGASGSAVGTALGEAASYYVAILTQVGTAAPTASVSLSTLTGSPVLSRVSEGVYRLTLAGAFTSAIDIKAALAVDQGLAPFQASAERIDDNTVEIRILDAGGNLTDGWGPLYLTIAVYG